MSVYINANTVQFTNNVFQTSNGLNIVSINLNHISFVNNDMSYCFSTCRNLTSVTNINENVTNMCRTFWYCTNLVNTPTVPNSVTVMRETFASCRNLATPPVIPDGCIDASGFISGCKQFLDENIYPSIPNSVQKLDYMYAVMSTNDTDVPQWCLDKWNNCSANVKTSMVGMFSGWEDLVNAPTIPNSVTNMDSTFHGCFNLVNAPTIPNSVTSMCFTFTSCLDLVNAPIIPNSVINMVDTFFSCHSLVNVPTIPDSVIDISRTFASCNSLTGNIFIQSENIINASQSFLNSPLQKNVYIPFNYANDERTATYNSFINAGYDEIGTLDNVYLKNLNPRRVLNVENFNYTSTGNDNITLTEYIGNNMNIVFPEIEEI